jgi:hypothetical protein
VKAERVRVAAARRSVEEAEGRVNAAAADALRILADLRARTPRQTSRTQLETDPRR